MKKKTKLLMLALIASLAFSGTMAACGGSEEESSSAPASESIVDPGENSSEEETSSGGQQEELKITLSETASLVEFETTALTARVTGADDEVTILWTSSDASIASVDANGVVTAHKAGSVTVTATVEGTDVKAECAVTVEKTNILHEIAFEIEEVKIYENEFEMVEASVTYNGETLDNEEHGIVYTWEKVSGEDGIVSMEADGAVATFTAIKAGTVTYKVSTTVRGYEASKTIDVTIMDNEYSYGLSNEDILESEGGYVAGLTLGSAESMEIGEVYGVLNGEPTDEGLVVEWNTDSDVISLENGVITANKAGEALVIGTTTFGGENLTINLKVVVAKEAVTISETMDVETANETFTLLDSINATNVEKISIGASVVFDAANSVGSIAGNVVTPDLAAMPSKNDDLGEGKTMTVETDRAIYTMTVNVYTMIINTKEELDSWQSIAADNSVRAGLCIEEQKQAVLSGYFILGDNIEYNGLWKPILPYAGAVPSRYELLTRESNITAWKEQYGEDKVIEEDWGAGKKAGFKGTFDGDGHYINGLQTGHTIYDAFISVLGMGGTVKNVAFTNAKIGAGCGLVIDRGFGTLENIYVEVDAIESGVEAGKLTNVIARPGNAQERIYRNIVIDMSQADLSGLKYAYVGDLSSTNAENVIVLGAEELELTKTGWDGGSDASVFWHHNPDSNDVAESFEKMSDLMANETYVGAMSNWDSSLWTLTDSYVVFASTADMYKGAPVFTNTETSIPKGDSLAFGTTNNDSWTLYSLKEEVAGVSISGNVVTVADAEVGASIVVVATNIMDGTTTEMTLTVGNEIITLADEVTIEVHNATTLTLPDTYEGTVSDVKLNGVSILSSIEGNVVTLNTANLPVKNEDLGEGKLLAIETSVATYHMTANVYTFIINTAEELDQWMEIAAENSVKAGYVIESQKGIQYSGYIVLGNDIDYYKIYTPYKAYGQLWSLFTQKSNWKEEYISEYTTTHAKVLEAYGAGKLVDGAIYEDWGAGNKCGFQGVFDGNGHSIRGLETQGQYSGFIITMGKNGIVKDVAFTGTKIGDQTGLIERGNNGGLMENVYVELAAMGSNAKISGTHGAINMKNVIVNASGCDFSATTSSYLLNLSGIYGENLYVIDKDQIEFTKTDFNTSTTPSAFWHFNANNNNDKGAKFATVEALLADETHGAIVAGLGGLWKVEDGKLYFGDLRVKTAAEKIIAEDAYATDADSKVTFINENLTIGTWSVSVDGGAATQVEVTTAGEATITISSATKRNVTVLFENDSVALSFVNVTYSAFPELTVKNTTYTTLAKYQGDETALGFAKGSYVFEANIANAWSDRVIIPADTSYDYVEFEVVFTAEVGHVTAWPAKDKSTKGSMVLYPRGMTTSDGLIRSIQVFDADGDMFPAQSDAKWAANTKYTIRICFNEGEDINEIHFAAVQTLYLANVSWGSHATTEQRVYDGTTGALHAYYDGDVTDAGFEAGTKVTAVTMTDAWSNRVRVNADQGYDYVDIDFSADTAIGSLCVWTYKTDGTICTGNYSVTATAATAANSAAERTIKIMDGNGNSITAFEAGKVYTLRIYLDDTTGQNKDTTVATVNVATFDCSASKPITFYFGNVSFGNDAA